MAIVRTLDRVYVRMKLNNGMDAQGNTKTVSQSLGALSPTGYDDEKAWDVIDALIPCLTKALYSTELAPTYTLTEDI